LGFELVRIEPASRIHSAEDVTLVNPTGSIIGYLKEDVATGRRHFVPIDGLLPPSPGSGTGKPTELPPPPPVIFRAFCPAFHDEPFGGTLGERGAWFGGEFSTLEGASSEASDHNATTGHPAVAKRYLEV
jgi:hypothetical protein